MTRPSTSQADKLVAYLQHRDWRSLARRLDLAVKRNRIRSARDGFPSGGGGPRSGDVSDPTFNAATGRDPKDQLAELVQSAATHLEQAVVHVQGLAANLDAIDRLADDKDLNPEPGCWAMARIGHWEPVHRSGDVGGRLKEARPLGRWAYDFTVNEGRLPTPEECRAHAEGRRVRLRAS